MTMTSNAEVIVVGAGPVGLLLACELAVAGVRVTVLERRAGTVPQSRALTMHGRTLEMLALRGVAGRFMARGMPISSGHFAGLPTRLDFSACDSTYPFTLFIPQSVTEQLLEAWAGELGVDVRRGAAVEVTGQGEEGVWVGGTQAGMPFRLDARFLVGADGARSLVRRQAGIAFDGLGATKTAMLGDVRLPTPPPGRAISVGNSAGGLMVVPLGGELYRVIVVDAQEIGVPLEVPVTLEGLSEATRRVAGEDFGMHSPEWLSRFSNQTCLAQSYRKGRIFLAGDAAHIHLPAGGQGMNVGMQDAMNLGWKLAGVLRGRADPSLLDSYEGERHPVGAALYRNTLAQSALMMDSFGPAGQALRATLSDLMKGPELNATLAHDLSGFGIRYPAALLSGAPKGDACARWTGRRLPDWPLQHADGAASSLYEHLASGRWLVLQVDGDVQGHDQPALDGAWVNTVTALVPGREAELDGVAALVVRPDGYVDHAVALRSSVMSGNPCSAQAVT
ncbi:FAD-dependent monooxygenase [Massilia pseudoviolaceinigra]|uniref:FAD-dependent monooxygenase n=1 Tax=Massilia pseudoviolaceinigra TaxID=3057165 RepID=UPI002796A1E3|nr:FAD-dependent monooxygenase [Massilia sp. CCM 9206]MDQ1921109.1 FAD-dependent monooxygenase [Massilia sp. CCM 9206]